MRTIMHQRLPFRQFFGERMMPVILVFLFLVTLSGCLPQNSSVKADLFASAYKGETKAEIAQRVKSYGVTQPSPAELFLFADKTDLAKAMFVEGFYPVGSSEFVSVPFPHEAQLKSFAESMGAARIHLSVRHHGVQYPGGDVFKFSAVFGVKCDERRHAGLLTQPAPEYLRKAFSAPEARQVIAVMKQSPAYFANILEGDVLTSVNGKSKTSGKAFRTGSNSVTVWRSGHALEKKVVLGKSADLSSAQSVLAENIRKDAATLSRKGKTIPAPEKSSPSLIASIPDMGKLQAVSSGTGFYFTNDGYLATNHHVIEKGARFLVLDTRTGEYAEADFVAQDPEGDLAILHVRGKKSQPIPLAKRFDLRRGEDVMTLGYPQPRLQGAQQKATFGRVNSAKGIHDDISNVQVDLPIQPGNSGGPLIDSRGRTVGVVASTLGLRSQNVNYAIKIDLLHTLIGTVPGLNAASSSSGRKHSFPDLAEKFESSVVMIRVYK